MGCYNVACNLTQTSIGEGDLVFWIPLIPTPNPWQDSRKKSNNNYLSTTGQFTPIACPVLGKYNDYGSLNNIVENSNTKTLENYFGKNIYEINELEDLFVEKEGIKIPVSGTYVSQEAFEYFKVNSVDEFGDTLANLNNSSLTEDLLSLIGFIHTDEKSPEYHDIWKNPNYPEIAWATAWGNTGDLIYKDKKYYPYNVLDLQKQIEKLTSISTNVDILNTLNNTWSDLFHVKSKIRELRENSTMWSRFKSTTDLKFSEGLLGYEIDEFFKFLIGGILFNTESIFSSLYGLPENWGQYAEDFANLRFLDTCLAINSRFWSPQRNGYQNGNYYQEKVLAEFILSRAIKSIEEREEIEFEDEE